jgi:hypothetical protein
MNSRNDPASSYLLWLAVLTALIAYSLPWVVAPGVSLTFGGYDLAEWASLHPEVRANPLLLTSLLLRLQPCLLALMVAFGAAAPTRTRWWWMRAVVVVIIAIALLPPLEFFSVARDDMNYRQQFAIALVTLLGGIAGLSGRFSRYHRVIVVGIATIGFVTTLVGLIQANHLMSAFQLPVQLGLGGILLTAIYGAIGTMSVAGAYIQIKQTR